MGSWVELDAIYPPGALSPATALIVALAHLNETGSIYLDGKLADFLPKQGLAYDAEMIERAEHWLREHTQEEFLDEIGKVLGPEQRLVLMLNVLDRLFASGLAMPERHPLYGRFLEALGLTPDVIAPYRAALVMKNNLAIFPQ
jgi:hypothetical protein